MHVIRWIVLLPAVILGGLVGSGISRHSFQIYAAPMLPEFLGKGMSLGFESLGLVAGAHLAALIAPTHHQIVSKVVSLACVGLASVGLFTGWLVKDWAAVVSAVIVLGLCGANLAYSPTSDDGSSMLD